MSQTDQIFGLFTAQASKVLLLLSLCGYITHVDIAGLFYQVSPDDARPRGIDHVVIPNPELSLQDSVPKGHAPRRQQLVEGGHVGAAGLRDPPLTGILVVKFHLEEKFK